MNDGDPFCAIQIKLIASDASLGRTPRFRQAPTTCASCRFGRGTGVE